MAKIAFPSYPMKSCQNGIKTDLEMESVGDGTLIENSASLEKSPLITYDVIYGRSLKLFRIFRVIKTFLSSSSAELSLSFYYDDVINRK